MVVESRSFLELDGIALGKGCSFQSWVISIYMRQRIADLTTPGLSGSAPSPGFADVPPRKSWPPICLSISKRDRLRCCHLQIGLAPSFLLPNAAQAPMTTRNIGTRPSLLPPPCSHSLAGPTCGDQHSCWSRGKGGLPPRSRLTPGAGETPPAPSSPKRLPPGFELSSILAAQFPAWPEGLPSSYWAGGTWTGGGAPDPAVDRR